MVKNKGAIDNYIYVSVYIGRGRSGCGYLCDVLRCLIIDILSRYHKKGPYRIFGLGPHHVLIRP